MKKLLLTTLMVCSGFAFAGGPQNSASAVNSNQNISASGALSGSTGNITSFNYSNPAATTANINNTGTSTIKTVPMVYAPPIGVTAPCYVALSGGLSVVGFGIAAGGSIEDAECTMRETSRLLFGIGQPEAAAKVMCNNKMAAKALGSVCDEPVTRKEPEKVSLLSVDEASVPVTLKSNSNIQCISDKDLAAKLGMAVCN